MSELHDLIEGEKRKLTVTCRSWTPRQSGTLQGFAAIHIREMRLTIRDVPLHEKNGRRWAQLPAKPQVDQDGRVVVNGAGKRQYVTILEWDSKGVADAFSAAVVRAVDEHFAQIGGRAA